MPSLPWTLSATYAYADSILGRGGVRRGVEGGGVVGGGGQKNVPISLNKSSSIQVLFSNISLRSHSSSSSTERAVCVLRPRILYSLFIDFQVDNCTIAYKHKNVIKNTLCNCKETTSNLKVEEAHDRIVTSRFVNHYFLVYIHQRADTQPSISVCPYRADANDLQ